MVLCTFIINQKILDSWIEIEKFHDIGNDKRSEYESAWDHWDDMEDRLLCTYLKILEIVRCWGISSTTYFVEWSVWAVSKISYRHYKTNTILSWKGKS